MPHSTACGHTHDDGFCVEYIYDNDIPIACFNPLLAEECSRKRPDLLAATEKQLQKIAAATKPAKRPLRGKQNIGLRAGKILNRCKMGKHFQLRIEEDSFHFERKKANIEREQSLDGIYVIRTSVKRESLTSQQVAASYKNLSSVGPVPNRPAMG